MMKCSVCGENMQTLYQCEETRLTYMACSGENRCTRYQVFDPNGEIFVNNNNVKMHAIKENS